MLCWFCKTNTTCYTKLKRCELALGNFRARNQLFNVICFYVQHIFIPCMFMYCIFSFSPLAISTVRYFHVLHFQSPQHSIVSLHLCKRYLTVVKNSQGTSRTVYIKWATEHLHIWIEFLCHHVHESTKIVQYIVLLFWSTCTNTQKFSPLPLSCFRHSAQ